MSYQEIERRRSIVVGNIPKLAGRSLRTKMNYDYSSICNLLDFLGIECNPVSVYRLSL